MANAQVLLLVLGPSIPAESLRALVATAAGQVGFTPGPWTSATGSSRAVRDASSARGATFSEGPWVGLTFTSGTTDFPAVPFSMPWTALRMNALNGPETGDPTTALLDRIRAGLAALADVSSSRVASRTPRNAISWDRNVPAPIVLPESGAGSGRSSSAGWLTALGLIGALAWFARSGIR